MIRKIGSVRLKVIWAGFLCVLVSNVVLAASDDAIRVRISPAGEPCVVGQACASGVSATTAGGDGPKDPEMVYQTFCFACHGTGVNEAPVLGDTDAWAPRIAKGIDTLYESSISGFNNNAMPAKGLCMDCSDDDLKATVDYLVNAVQ